MAFENLAPQVIAGLSRDLQITPQQAAGIVGQLGYESAGLQAINEQNPVIPGSRGGFGWAQWTGPRRKQFEAWAAQNNMDVTAPQANYGFLVHELTNTPENRVLEQIRQAPDAQTAGRVFTDVFLRPGIPAYDKRASWTEKALNFIMPTAQAGTLQSGMAAKITKAKEAGYSDAEIEAYLGQKPEFSAKLEKAREAGYSDAEIFAHLGMRSAEKPISQSVGETLMDIPRQLGLTARYGIEGLGQAASVLTEPIRQAINPALDFVGLPRAASTGDTAASFANALGLPTPQTANERVVGDAARLMAGGGGIMGASGALARGASGATQAVLQGLASNPGSQLASATGAGLAGGSVREAGGGPAAQTIAGFAGGLAGPMALSAGQRAATAIAKKIPVIGPKQVEQQINLVMQRSGVDWGAVPERVRNQVRGEVREALRIGDDLDADAVRRLVDFRQVDGAIPTRGAITLDPVQITRERNLAKAGANSSDRNLQGLAQVENTNNQSLIRALNNQGANAADDMTGAGQRIINELEMGIDARQGRVESLYAAARDTSGRSLPLDPAAFSTRVNSLLDENMVGFALPADVRNTINRISTGEMPFSVEVAEQIKKRIASLQRSSSDGSTRYALGLVRQSLDDTPLLSQRPDRMSPVANEAGQRSIDAFNQARAAHRQKMEWVESVPAVKAVFDGKVTPDQFVNRFIISKAASSDDVRKLADAVRANPEVAQSVRGQITAFLKEKALGGAVEEQAANFSPAAYNRALSMIGDRKLAAFFGPEEVEQLKAIGRVGAYMKAQPAGSAVNNSNSGALVMGRGLDLMDRISGKIPLGIGNVIQGTISGVQQGAAQRVIPALVRPSLPMQAPSLMPPAAVYGGLLGLAPVPPRNDDSR